MRLRIANLAAEQAGEPVAAVAPGAGQVQPAESLRRREDAAAVDDHRDVVARRRSGHALFGVRREEPGVPDFIVWWCGCAGVQQSRQRGHVAVVAGILERPFQGVGKMRIEDDGRFHFRVAHCVAVPWPAGVGVRCRCKEVLLRHFTPIP